PAAVGAAGVDGVGAVALVRATVAAGGVAVPRPRRDPDVVGAEGVVLGGGVAGVLVAPVRPRAGDRAAVHGVAVGAAGGVRPVGGAAAAARAGAAEHRPAAVGVQPVVLVEAVAEVVAAR